MRTHILQTIAIGLIVAGTLASSQAFGADNDPGIRQTAEVGGPTAEQRLDIIEQRFDLIIQHLAPAREATANTRNENQGRNVRQDDSRSAPKRDRVDLNKRLRRLEAKAEYLMARLHETLVRQPATGALVINNWTGAGQVIRVNGVLYSVPAGSTSISVPYAIVEAYVPSWEEPKLWGMSNWKNSGKHRTMTINIRPT